MLRLSKGRRAIGKIKSSAEDFVVEEITPNGAVLALDTNYAPKELGFPELGEGRFAVFVMQKTNWNTTQALKAVANKLGKGIRSVGFAGTKDRTSESTQLCSIFGAKPENALQVHLKDIKINGAWFGDKKLEMGELSGNRFSITVREAKDQENLEPLEKLLNGLFPNYFGHQRFGSRKNNFEVGVDILKGDFRSAVMKFLTDTDNEINEEAVLARKRLKEEQDFKAALGYFPTYLKYERSVIEYLSRFEKNYTNAILRLPRQISLMFVHSVEDKIFNMEVEKMIEKGHTSPQKGDIVCRPDELKFYDLSSTIIYDGVDTDTNSLMVGNILGYETKAPTELEQLELEKLGLSLESFKAKGVSALNCKGAKRVIFAPYKTFDYEQLANDALQVKFSLPAGSYATVFLEELIETQGPGGTQHMTKG